MDNCRSRTSGGSAVFANDNEPVTTEIDHDLTNRGIDLERGSQMVEETLQNPCNVSATYTKRPSC